MSKFAKFPLEPIGGVTSDPIALGDYKVSCLYQAIMYLAPHKPHWSDEQILEQIHTASALFDFIPTNKLFEKNFVTQLFPVWVFIAVHLKSPHTLMHTGSKNGYHAIFLAQRLQLEILRRVVLKIIDHYGQDYITRRMMESHKIHHIPFELFGLHSTYLPATERQLLWYWLCMVASCFTQKTLINLVQDHVATEFTDKSVVADHLYTGEYISVCSILDTYVYEVDRTYLLRFGIELPPGGGRLTDELSNTINPGSALAQIISEKQRWPT